MEILPHQGKKESIQERLQTGERSERIAKVSFKCKKKKKRSKKAT